MPIHDLTIPIRDGTDWYGEADCAPVAVTHVGDLATDGWRSHALSLMVLNGTTYLETAAHLYADAPTLDQVAPDRFVLCAHVVQLPAGVRELPAPEADLPDFRPGEEAILLSCGWDARACESDFYHASPYFSAGLQEWLLERRPAILGGDMLSFDQPEDAEMPFLRAYFGTGGMILCPLTGLRNLPEAVTLCAAPLRLEACNAAPCRALAWW